MVMSTQLWPHCWSWAGQLAAQVAAAQRLPPQLVPHAPQLAGSEVMSTHDPQQSVSPVWQLHAAEIHVLPVVQACPQLPQ